MQMSGGERKMLSVARALLARDPHLFLRDECFKGLSPTVIPIRIFFGRRG